MKIQAASPLVFSVAVVIVMCGWQCTATGKPRGAATPAPQASAMKPVTETPAATPAGTADPSAPLARWLLQQDGGPGAVVLPLAEIVRAATGKTVLPLARGNPADAALIQRLGAVLDGVLPLMNRPDSPAHATVGLTGMASAFEDALAAKLAGSPDVVFPTPETVPARVAGSYPSLRFVDKASGRTCYLGVSLFAAANRTAATRGLSFHPAEAAPWFIEDGCCLLVGIETNGKLGKDAAFLNWELIDLAKLPVRAAITFEGSQEAVHMPGAVLNDGRKGRD